MEDLKINMPPAIEEKIDEIIEDKVPDEINDAFPDVIVPEPLEDDDDDEPLPVIEPKLFLTEEDVFSKHNEITHMVPVVKKVRKRRTMTEESLAKLAIARQKAMETRKRNAELRKEGKMKTKKDIIKDIENRRPVVNNVVHKTENITNNITHEDIMKIASETTSQALLSYEKERKILKAEKKKKYEEEHAKQIIKKTLMVATGKTMGSPGFYSSCF